MEQYAELQSFGGRAAVSYTSTCRNYTDHSTSTRSLDLINLTLPNARDQNTENPDAAGPPEFYQ